MPRPPVSSLQGMYIDYVRADQMESICGKSVSAGKLWPQKNRQHSPDGAVAVVDACDAEAAAYSRTCFGNFQRRRARGGKGETF